MTDGELLRRYARERSETAFEELVRRRISLVYSAALRQLNNDAHLAEDVTQTVFTDLARKARKLSHHASLTAWLYTSTRFVAANIRRTERRRATREEKAHAMNAVSSTQEPEADWSKIRPILDDAIHTLSDDDRESVLLRHFERCSYAEIGARLGLSEDGARMRVNRALEKLHDALSKHGVTSTALALAAALTRDAVGSTPAHLAARVTTTAIAGSANTGGLGFLLTSKIQLALAGFLLVVATVTVFNLRHSHTETSQGSVEAIAETNVATAAATIKTAPAMMPIENGANDQRLRLQIVTADSGQPIPFVPIQYFKWYDDSYQVRRTTQRTLTTDRFGVCDVRYPRNFTRLELIVGKAPFADIRLLWQKPLGDVVPSNYVLRVERAVPIGGTVVDSEGTPVSGAKVTWKLSAPGISESKPPPEHEYYGTEYDAITDSAGHWEIRRIAANIMPYLAGQAVESNYVDAEIFTSRDKSAREQLRESAFVFKLGHPVTAVGEVVDVDGKPIWDATIYVGNRVGKSRSDGKFSVRGCQPGTRQLFSVEASGFLSMSTGIDISNNTAPMHVVLQSGKPLRLRVVDAAGNPIANAFISPENDPFQKGQKFWFNSIDHRDYKTDSEGRLSWSNAPDVELSVSITGIGVSSVITEKIRPDGKEHIITLSQSSP